MSKVVSESLNFLKLCCFSGSKVTLLLFVSREGNPVLPYNSMREELIIVGNNLQYLVFSLGRFPCGWIAGHICSFFGFWHIGINYARGLMVVVLRYVKP